MSVPHLSGVKIGGYFIALIASAVVKLTRTARKHFVTLNKIGLYPIERNPEDSSSHFLAFNAPSVLEDL